MFVRRCLSVGCIIVMFFFTPSGMTQDINQALRLARDLERMGQWDQAREIYEGLYRRKPEHPLVLNRLKDFYMNTRDYERAKVFIEERRNKQPKDPSLDIYIAQIVYKTGKPEEALNLWQKVLDRYPKRVSVYQMVASCMMVERLLDEALDVYLLGRDRIGKTDQFALHLANLYGARMEYKKATEELLKYWEIHPKQFAYIEGQILRYPRTERVVREIVKPIEKTIASHPKDLNIRRILVSIYLRAGRYREGFKATREMEQLSVGQKQGEALFRFGQDAFRFGAPKEAEKAYLEILDAYPNFSSKDRILFGLAQSYEAQEMLPEAVETYQRVFDEFMKSPLARQSLYRKGLVQKDELFDLSGAAATFQTLIEKFPSTHEGEEGRLELGRCAIVQEDLDRAETIFKKALEFAAKRRGSSWVRARVYLADVAYFRGRFEEAASLLDELISEEMESKAMQDPILNDGLELRIFIEEHLKQSSEALGIFARAELLERQRKYKMSLEVLDSLLSQWPDDPIAADGLFKKGEIEIRLEKFQDGLSSFQALRNRFTNHILADRAVERVGWVYEKRGKPKKAMEQYETLLVEYPQSFLVDEVRRRIRRIEKERK